MKKVYDDFNDGVIDYTKWKFGSLAADFREVGGVLELRLKKGEALGYGSVTSVKTFKFKKGGESEGFSIKIVNPALQTTFSIASDSLNMYGVSVSNNLDVDIFVTLRGTPSPLCSASAPYLPVELYVEVVDDSIDFYIEKKKVFSDRYRLPSRDVTFSITSSVVEQYPTAQVDDACYYSVAWIDTLYSLMNTMMSMMMLMMVITVVTSLIERLRVREKGKVRKEEKEAG